jgi:hypothetical protein
MPVIPGFGRLRQEDFEFEINLGYIVRTCLQNKNKQVNKQTKSQSHHNSGVLLTYNPKRHGVMYPHKNLYRNIHKAARKWRQPEC